MEKQKLPDEQRSNLEQNLSIKSISFKKLH
jgi:hypothetical protein